jgi:serine/threonine-protein kinase
MRPKYLGRYRIIAELGKGSVGKVLRGEDEVLNRPVAIKLPNATDDKTIERLREECEALTQLQHPQIAQVYGSGSDPDRPLYIVAEYVDGLSVSGLLVKEKHLEVRRALQIALGVADALVYAHQRQPRVLHLDLKPTNVLVQGDTDQVKVTDFGLASVLTKPGARPTGTREYMAPEQAEGDGPDERADLYSLGVLLYEMLVGKRPPKLAAEPATPPSANTGITFPPELRERVYRLVLGLLARERKARAPQTAEQLAEELRAMLEGRPARLGASSRAPDAPAPSP